jgi:hypothetical protein
VRLGELEDVSRSESEQVGLRLFAGQRSATVASSDFSSEALATLVERCLAMARDAPEDPYAGLAPAELLEHGPFPYLDSSDDSEPDPAMLRAPLPGSARRGSPALRWKSPTMPPSPSAGRRTAAARPFRFPSG